MSLLSLLVIIALTACVQSASLLPIPKSTNEELRITKRSIPNMQYTKTLVREALLAAEHVAENLGASHMQHETANGHVQRLDVTRQGASKLLDGLKSSGKLRSSGSVRQARQARQARRARFNTPFYQCFIKLYLSVCRAGPVVNRPSCARSATYCCRDTACRATVI